MARMRWKPHSTYTTAEEADRFAVAVARMGFAVKVKRSRPHVIVFVRPEQMQGVCRAFPSAKKQAQPTAARQPTRPSKPLLPTNPAATHLLLHFPPKRTAEAYDLADCLNQELAGTHCDVREDHGCPAVFIDPEWSLRGRELAQEILGQQFARFVQYAKDRGLLGGRKRNRRRSDGQPRVAGDQCKHCDSPVLRRDTKKTTIGNTQTHYWRWFLWCPNCNATFFPGEAKVTVSNRERQWGVRLQTENADGAAMEEGRRNHQLEKQLRKTKPKPNRRGRRRTERN